MINFQDYEERENKLFSTHLKHRLNNALMLRDKNEVDFMKRLFSHKNDIYFNREEKCLNNEMSPMLIIVI
jgi:hypothetical protein